MTLLRHYGKMLSLTIILTLTLILILTVTLLLILTITLTLMFKYFMDILRVTLE